MVPIEQLSDRNFWHIYFIASEIKRELEITPDTKKYIEISDSYPYNASGNQDYPYFYQNREQAIVYLVSIGMVLSYYHLETSSRKIRITPPPQEVFFSFCSKLAGLYNQRFVKPNEGKMKVDALSDEQIEKLHKIIETVAIALSQSHPPHIIYIPIVHFSQEVQQFDIIGLLYKLDKDFGALTFSKMVGLKPAEKELEIHFASGDEMINVFRELQKNVGARYLDIIANKKSQPLPTTPPKKEPLEVRLVHGSQVAVAKTEEERKYKFPHKLPRNIRWEQVTFQFIDESKVLISARDKKHEATYKDIGLVGKGKEPSVLWAFLKVLAKYNGEITIQDADAKDAYVKQVESLSLKLEQYMGIDFPPFFPYKASLEKPINSYKAKFAIYPPTKGFAFEGKPKAKEDVNEESLEDEIKAFMNESAPLVAD